MPVKFLRECYITILETPYGEKAKVVKQEFRQDTQIEPEVDTAIRQLVQVEDRVRLHAAEAR